MKAKLSFSIVLGLLLMASSSWGGEFSNPFKRKPPQETQQPAPIAERVQPREVAPARITPVQPPPAQRQEDQPPLQPPPDNIDTIDEGHHDAADIADGNEGPYKLNPEVKPIYVVDNVVAGKCSQSGTTWDFHGKPANNLLPGYPNCNSDDKWISAEARKNDDWGEISYYAFDGAFFDNAKPCIVHFMRFCQPTD